VSAATLDARARLFKWFAKNADVRDRRVQIDPGRRGKGGEEGLRSEVEGRLRELGVARIAPGAIDEILRRSGTSLGETLQEVDRIVLALSDPTKLAAADVEQAMRDLSLGWVFDFTSALETKNLAAAETMIARLLDEGEPPLRIVALMGSHVAKLMTARSALGSLPPGWLQMRGTDFLRGPGASLPGELRGWPGYFRLRAAANFSDEELRRLHGEVRLLDLALKSSPASPVLLFSRLLQRVCITNRAA
jgi:DNA polymerase-3 subunit delta